MIVSGQKFSRYHVYVNEITTLSGAVITSLNNMHLQYKVLLNGSKIYPATEYTALTPPPVNVAQVSVDYKDMLDGANTLAIVTKDSRGGERQFNYKIYKEPINTPNMKRDCEFEDGYSYDQSRVITRNGTLAIGSVRSFVEDGGWLGNGRKSCLDLDLRGTFGVSLEQ